ncbi:hypothetical protein SAMN04515617_105159 [Collimonas sp. OK242]|uniref:hypothetical protein n=1 Tax=Collimonas sp. OK242 TaxID=1798195 RepID=UPI00089759EF|nr:hypothetical protein [Collimonas sp. OK242]SDX63376.1 hypothetical protein SAMN04515617_105159 [Collimonas sp. OK242]
MSDHSLSRLPDKSSWCFNQIACSDLDRASALEIAGPPRALLKATVRALDDALCRSDVRFGREHAGSQPDDCRAVVQFSVGVGLFDWFFNARTGYRAHFRGDYKFGLEFEKRIIIALRLRLNAKLLDVVFGRELNENFEDEGEAQIPKHFLIDSLTPNLAKVWFCTRRIKLGGGIERLPTGVVGPRILLDHDKLWAAPCREHDTAWLDIKGAFLGKAGPYQLKGPICRAKKLHDEGEA